LSQSPVEGKNVSTDGLGRKVESRVHIFCRQVLPKFVAAMIREGIDM
jgi:hypothetical protein